MSRKPRHRMMSDGRAVMKALSGPAATSITATAMTTAAIIT